MRKWIFPFIVMGFVLTLSNSCKKDNNDDNNDDNSDDPVTTVTDIDGNVYSTVTIGTQVWMAENLKTTRYRNGDLITNVTGEQWDDNASGAYCSYDNSADNLKTYGLLYNWYAVNDSRIICPEGWHIPTVDEWETLSNTGLALKEANTTHWMSPNETAQNESGFSALPGGVCGFDGNFNALTEMGYWWTTDEDDIENSWLINMSNNNPGISGWINMNKWIGASVRCIQD